MSTLFPAGFLWGAATSAHQVEGHNANCDSWVEEEAAGSPYIDRSGAAIEHYQRFREDIALMASLGLTAYRFSVEWARIEPQEGEFSEEALAHYRAVVDACVEHGLAPVVTLVHFTSPRWLMALGGWKGERTPALFARYAARVMTALGPAVAHVLTMNECNIGVLLHGMFSELAFVPPVGLDPATWRAPAWREAAAQACGTTAAIYCNFLMAGDAQGAATIAAAHRAAREAIRRVAPGVQVGLTLALSQPQFVAGGEAAAARMWQDNFRQWLPVIEGDDFFGFSNYKRFGLIASTAARSSVNPSPAPSTSAPLRAPTHCLMARLPSRKPETPRTCR